MDTTPDIIKNRWDVLLHCDDPFFSRYLREPWTDGAFTYATDGVTLLRISGCHSQWNYDAECPPPPLEIMDFDFTCTRPARVCRETIAALKTLHHCRRCDAAATDDPGKCPRCKGEGWIYWARKDAFYTCSRRRGTGMRLRPIPERLCQKCHGSGWGSFDVVFRLGLCTLAPARIEAAVNNLDDVVFYPDRIACNLVPAVGFSFAGGLGIIAGMDPTDGRQTGTIIDEAKLTDDRETTS